MSPPTYLLPISPENDYSSDDWLNIAILPVETTKKLLKKFSPAKEEKL